MLPDEKDRLLTLFADQHRWCQDAEAKNTAGEAVRYDDPGAVAWDMTGGMCLLFGWRRACELFCQLDRHIHGVRRNGWRLTAPAITSMTALQDRNDEAGTTFEMIAGWLRTMPVWNGPRQQGQGTKRDAPSPGAVFP